MQKELFQEARSKYGNEPVKANGLRFDSQVEYKRFLVLCEMERDGEIQGLEVHKRFGLYCPGPGGVRVKVADYECDFFYVLPDGQFVIEDVKGAITEVYALKKKWMAAQGLEIQEVRV